VRCFPLLYEVWIAGGCVGRERSGGPKDRGKSDSPDWSLGDVVLGLTLRTKIRCCCGLVLRSRFYSFHLSICFDAFSTSPISCLSHLSPKPLPVRT
jgi:hypothetical protein